MQDLDPRCVLRLTVQNPVPGQQLNRPTVLSRAAAIMRGFKGLPPQRLLIPRGEYHSPVQGNRGCTPCLPVNQLLRLQLVVAGMARWEGSSGLPPCSSRSHLFGEHGEDQVTSCCDLHRPVTFQQ